MGGGGFKNINELKLSTTVFHSSKEKLLVTSALEHFRNLTADSWSEFKNPLFQYSTESLIVNTIKVLCRLESSGRIGSQQIDCTMENALNILLITPGLGNEPVFLDIMNLFALIPNESEEMEQDNMNVADFMVNLYASEAIHLFYGNLVLFSVAQKCAISACSVLKTMDIQ